MPQMSNEILTRFLHGCYFSPVKSTLLKAIKKNLYGHQDHQRINKLSNKQANKERELVKGEATEDVFPTVEAGELKCNYMFLAVTTEEETKKVYTDQTGAFPTGEKHGERYIIVAYVYDCNTIIAKP